MLSGTPTYAEAMSGCIDACQRAHHSCLETAQMLLESRSNVGGSKLLEALTHCIGMTRLAAEMLLTDSGSHEEACELCTKSCRNCADICMGDPDLKSCMKACLECAQYCQVAVNKETA